MPTKTGKLSPKAERYCDLRVTGASPIDAMERAGFKLDQNADRTSLIKKANTYDRHPYIQDRIAALRQKLTVLESEQRHNIPPSFFKHLDLNENEMSRNWVNQAAYTVYQQALRVENFHQALTTLKFIAELNNFLEHAKASGRPKNDKAPNDTESGFNHDSGADTRTPEEDAGFAVEFEGLDGSDGEEPPNKRAAARKVQTRPSESSGDVEDDEFGFDESDQWDAGADGKD